MIEAQRPPNPPPTIAMMISDFDEDMEIEV
jgi:hypothetical protein